MKVRPGTIAFHSKDGLYIRLLLGSDAACLSYGPAPGVALLIGRWALHF